MHKKQSGRRRVVAGESHGATDSLNLKYAYAW